MILTAAVVVLIAAVSAEGYYIYRQTQVIDALISQFEAGASPAQAGGMALVDMATPEKRRETTETGKPSGDTTQQDFVVRVSRGFTLPGPVNDSGMTHEYHDGVLTVTIPKQSA